MVFLLLTIVYFTYVKLHSFKLYNDKKSKSSYTNIEHYVTFWRTMLKYNNPQTGLRGDGAHFKENKKFKRALPTHFNRNQTDYQVTSIQNYQIQSGEESKSFGFLKKGLTELREM